MNRAIGILLLAACAATTQAGIIDPDCTPEKVAKNAALKATVGVGGRCTAKEAISDSLGGDDKKDDAKDKLSDRLEDAKDDSGHKLLKKSDDH